MKKWFSFNPKNQRVEEVQPSLETFNNPSLLFWSRGMENWENGTVSLNIFLNPPVIQPIIEETQIIEQASEEPRRQEAIINPVISPKISKKPFKSKKSKNTKKSKKIKTNPKKKFKKKKK